MNYLILSPSDIYYLTGAPEHGVGEIMILQKKEKSIVFCDPRTSGLFDTKKFTIMDSREGWVKEFKKYKTLATDGDFLTQNLRIKLEKFGPKFVTKPSPITSARLIKTPEEIKKLRKSQQLNKKVFEKIQPFLQPGVTEGEIARKILILQLELGASGPSFAPIVAFGENSAIPHHNPTKRKLQPIDIILIDMGLVYAGYCSDMTRTFFLKQKKQNKKEKEIIQLLEKITKHIIAWAKPGMAVRKLDQEARKMMGKYSEYFTHSLGHGVGIDVHESPGVSSRSKEILRPGMVITIEPGIYLPGEFGARYEEMVVITEKGSEAL